MAGQIDVSGFGRPVRSFTQGLQGGLQLGLAAVQSRREREEHKRNLAFKSVEAQSKLLESVKSLTNDDRANLMTNISQTLQSVGAIAEAKTYTADDMKSTVLSDFNKHLKQLNSDNKVGAIPNQDYINGLVDLMETTATMTNEQKALAENAVSIVRKSREKTREVMNKKKPFEEQAIGMDGVKLHLRGVGLSEDRVEQIIKDRPGIENTPRKDFDRFSENVRKAQGVKDPSKSINQQVLKNIVNMQARGEDIPPKLLEQGKRAAEALGGSLDEFTGPRRFLGLTKGEQNVQFSSDVPDFSSIEEAENAGLRPGTTITINGRRAVFK